MKGSWLNEAVLAATLPTLLPSLNHSLKRA
jgi:hypothetical protein